MVEETEERRDRRKVFERERKFPEVTEEIGKIKLVPIEEVEVISKTKEEISRGRIERAEEEGRLIKSCPNTPKITLAYDRSKPRGQRFKRLTSLV